MQLIIFLIEVIILLGKRLIQLRKDRNLTQEKLSEYLNISRATYAQYELGRRQPDYETLEIIANFFNVTTDYLLGRTNIPNSSSKPLNLDKEPTRQDLEDLLRTSNVQFNGSPLDDSDKEEIIDVLKFVWEKLRKDKPAPNEK